MKIVHVATLITPDGTYGGPIRVATNLVKELGTRGHECSLWAGSRGYSPETRWLDGVSVRLNPARVVLPALGFATTMAPGMLLRVFADRKGIDLLHIHLARDFVTLPAALAARALRIPYVVQTHGMIGFKAHPLARLFDAVFTRPALRGAAQILYLTSVEEGDLRLTDPKLTRLSRLGHGIELPPTSDHANKTASCEVLFLARMHARKRPQVFVRSAIGVLRRGGDATFRLVGPDEGEVAPTAEQIRRFDHGGKILYEGALPQGRTNERISQCDLYVLPSVNEPFGMSVMEAMALGKPVIVTDSCGLAPYIESAGAGMVVGPEESELEHAMQHLVECPRLRREMGERGRELVQREFGIAAVGDRLTRVYQEALAWSETRTSFRRTVDTSKTTQ